MHYWASPLEAKLCAGQEVALVGAGNSAGQAAVYLAAPGRQGLDAGPRAGPREPRMSRYLIDRIAALPNVEVVTQAQWSPGSTAATARWRRSAGARGGADGAALRVRHLFLFIGAEPNTDWLRRLGRGARRQGLRANRRRTANGPPALETSVAGVFAIGDVRSGSVKRVAAAVGEGAQVVAALHAFLAPESDVVPAKA